MQISVVNAEADRHRIKKSGFYLGHALSSMIVSGVEDQFINPLGKPLGREDRFVGAAIIIVANLFILWREQVKKRADGQ